MYSKSYSKISDLTSKHAHETEINSDQDAHESARTFEESRELHAGRAQSLGDDGDGEAR